LNIIPLISICVHKACCDLPDEYGTNQVVITLCQGCLDKTVGSVAAPFQPKTVEDALERIKWLQHSNQAIFGGTVRGYMAISMAIPTLNMITVHQLLILPVFWLPKISIRFISSFRFDLF
jgi:hypothetical protein